jgi:MFS family permease
MQLHERRTLVRNRTDSQMNPSISPLQTLLVIGIGTCLSLLGDASMYTVLPTHTPEAGITVAAVGIVLSANRWVRLVLNGPMGIIYDRLNRRPFFVAALFIGAISTAIYGFTNGFWPLLMGRLLWGLSWAGIWVGGNTIILDITRLDNRGRWMGFYQTAFFLGAASGSIIGGTLTDLVGYHNTMKIHAGLTLLGAMIALIFLPETRSAVRSVRPHAPEKNDSLFPSAPLTHIQLISATALHGVNRIVMAGILASTFGLYLLEKFGETIQISDQSYGVATITGIGLGSATLISMFSAPISGAISDRIKNRWQTASGGLLPGMAGLSLLAIGSPLTIMMGIPLTATTSGSNQGLSTTLVGELGQAGRRGRRLGGLFTVGDLMSAIGPLLAYALIPVIQLKGVYILAASLYASMFLVTLWLATRSNPSTWEVE